jgi:hypothetical protein
VKRDFGGNFGYACFGETFKEPLTYLLSSLTSVLERNIQIELYRVLKNFIEKKFSYNGTEFVDVKFEPTINGRPDLVVEAIDKGKKIALLVIETKRKVPFIDRKFDPYSIDVIRQAPLVMLLNWCSIFCNM